jgi:hypothetical protein
MHAVCHYIIGWVAPTVNPLSAVADGDGSQLVVPPRVLPNINDCASIADCSASRELRLRTQISAMAQPVPVAVIISSC